MARVSVLSCMAIGVIAIAPASLRAQANEVLTNESVVSLVTSKVPKDLILTKIRTTKSTFDVTPSGLIGLNLNKVPTDVMKAMLLAASPTPASRETLDNDAVIKMVGGQLPKDVIMTKIQVSRPNYDLTTNGIIALNQNKVSQDVVKAMMAASAAGTSAPATTPAPAGSGRRGG